MSESKNKEQASAVTSKLSAKVLFRRRTATVLYLLFLGLCLAGTQGPWYEVWAADKLVGQPVKGPDFLRFTHEKLQEEPDPTDLFAKYRTRKIEHSVTPSNLAAVCCLIALFLVVYNLFGDHDKQLPLFMLSLVIACSAGYVVYRVWADNKVIEEVMFSTEGERIKPQLAPVVSGGKTVVAAGVPKSSANRLPVWKPLWGYALFVSSALVLLLNATYLTLIAQRGEP